MMVKGRNLRRDGVDTSAGGPIAFAGLTPTGMRASRGVPHGLVDPRITFGLGIAKTTVKAHMPALMRKRTVRNRTRVAIVAPSLGGPVGQASIWTSARYAA